MLLKKTLWSSIVSAEFEPRHLHLLHCLMPVPKSLKSYPQTVLRRWGAVVCAYPERWSVRDGRENGREQPLAAGAAEKSRAAITAQLPAGYQPVFMNPLVSLYAARDMKPMWENRGRFRLSSSSWLRSPSPVFSRNYHRVSLLTDPAVSGMARDIVLSDAMMGYLHFISGIPVQGNRWLYGTKPYTMATPPLSVINQWQLALDNGSLVPFIGGLAPKHPQYEAMHRRCWRWWPIPVRGRS